jgi:uncharacterized protein (TIGR03067 family)
VISAIMKVPFFPSFVFGGIVMRRHPFSLVVIALLSTTACSRPRSPEAAPGAQPRPAATLASPRDLAKKDLDQLQGTWRIESSLWNGVREPDIARSVTIIFQGDTFICVDKDGNRLPEETIRLMPDQNPKAIDCSSKGGGRAAPGIYTLEGDTFTWCSAGGNNKVRPTSFASDAGSKRRVMVLRRPQS